MAKAKKGDTVKVHYTGTLKNGEKFDSSEGRDPLEFKLGDQQVIPGFETAVEGLEVGEAKTVSIPASDAYGERSDDLVMTAALKDLNLDFNPKKGDQLTLQRSDGQQIPVRVVDVSEVDITIDANHPLAGEELTFKIELTEIK